MLRYTYIACLVEYYKVTTGLKSLKLDSKEQGVVNENDKTRKMRDYIIVTRQTIPWVQQWST